MKYKNGNDVKLGDVIRWKCLDNDDLHAWTFTGLVTGSGVVYLGGGIDFGMAIGHSSSYEEVQNEADNNDAYEAGIEKVGVAADLERYIAKFNT